jgi:hypothetical protein
MRGSTREISGLEWVTTAPSAGTAVTFEYTYNRLPELLGAIVDQNKQITTDVLVHECQFRNLYVNLVVIYSSGTSPLQVDPVISSVLSSWASSLVYGDWVRLSNIEGIVNSVSGVDSVRITKSTDNGTNYGVQEVLSPGTLITTATTDFKLDDDELAVLYNIRTIRKSLNTFG